MSDTNSTSDGPRTAELAEQIVNAIQYPDERVHFIRQALQLVPDEHPMAGSIRAELEFALRLINEVGDDPAHGDVTNHLRGAYGDLPLGPDDVGSTASGGEDGQDGPEAVTDGGEAVTADDGDEGGSALEEPPEDVRWQGENNERAVVELELTRPLVEWIELEANENDFDGVTDWIETQIQVALQRDLLENHDIRREVEVDLPLEFVARMRYYENDLRQRGNETSFEDIAVNHVQLDRTYLLDGEPLGSDRLEDRDVDEA